MEFVSHLYTSLTSPVNCLVGYGSAVLGATGNFVHCVVNNLTNIV